MIRGLALLALVALVAGCGGGAHRVAEPSLPRALAASLATRADGVAAALAARDACRAQRVAARLRAEVNRSLRRIPAALLEPLSGDVNELQAALPRCGGGGSFVRAERRVRALAKRLRRESG